MAQIIRVILQFVDKMSKGLKGAEKNMEGMGKKAQTLHTRSQQLGRTTAELEDGLAKQGMAVNRAGKAYDKLTGRIVDQDKAFGKAARMTNRFRMELLGIMFFGMMIQRVFLGLARTGVDTFMKITEGQTQAGQAITSLSAGFQYLKFSIGEALGTTLMPFMDTIIGIIESVVDWIERNPELVGWLIILGAAIGSLLLVVGSLGLGITSTMQGWAGFKAAATAIGWSKLASGIKKVRGALSPLMLKIMLIIGFVIFLWQAWEHNWFNIRQFTGTVVKGIANAFFYLVEAGQILYNGIATIWNAIVSSIQWAANGIIDLINAIGGAYAWLTGQQYTAMEKWNLSPLIVDLKEVNKQIDEWQQKTGQSIYGLGENIYMSGERMNAGTMMGEDKYSITRAIQGAMGQVTSGFQVNEMNINVNATNVEGGKEAGIEAGRGVFEAASEYGYKGGGVE